MVHNSAGARDQSHLELFAVQIRDGEKRVALGAAHFQHRNHVQHFDFFHEPIIANLIKSLT